MKVRCTKFEGDAELFCFIPFKVGDEYNMVKSYSVFNKNISCIIGIGGMDYIVSKNTSPDNPEQKFFVVGFAGWGQFTFEKVE